MTTFFPFQPSNRQPFRFQPTLDGQVYSVTVTWSLFGQRYYINVYALDGTPVVSTALVGSPPGLALQNLAWESGKATAAAVAPHGFKVGRTINLTVSGAIPDAFNGQVPAFITGPTTFSYPIPSYPGAATAFGAVAFNLSMIAGYFASTLVYRNGQFEVSP